MEHPKTIWLQPWCDGCEKSQRGSYDGGRSWCEDDAWVKCDDCDARPVRYEISPDQPAPVVTDDLEQ